jgi:drug/metabolite transporter (DMT)-like permease
MNPFQLVAARFLLAFPVLVLLARIKGVRWANARPRLPLVIGAMVFSGHYVLQALALELTSATNAGWIVAFAPLAIVILAGVFLRESIGRSTRIGILLATVGIVLLVSRGDSSRLGWLTASGDWMLLASTFSWAVYTVVTRNVSRQTHPLAVTVLMTLPLAVAAFVALLVDPSWLLLTSLEGKGILALVFLAVCGIALAQWFWLEGVSKLGASRAGLFLYLEPIATTSLAVPYLGEFFGWTTLLGGALVLLGVFVSRESVRPSSV